MRRQGTHLAEEQLAAEGLPASEAAAAAAAAAAGGHVAAVMRPEFEEARAVVLPRLMDVMPHLQRLHLLNCSASGRNISLPLLLQWAGPCLQELVLANVHLKDDRFETADAPLDLAPLLRLRRFDWVECRLPMVTGGPVIGLSQLLTFLQDKAPQLQQLKVAAGETQPLLDWHVPLLLGMQQLRRLEVFVGPDVFAELAMRCNQRQQQASATTAADAGATVPSQHQRQQQLSAVLAAMQSLQLHVLQAARFARQVERLADQHVHTTALMCLGRSASEASANPTRTAATFAASWTGRLGVPLACLTTGTSQTLSACQPLLRVSCSKAWRLAGVALPCCTGSGRARLWASTYTHPSRTSGDEVQCKDPCSASGSPPCRHAWLLERLPGVVSVANTASALSAAAAMLVQWRVFAARGVVWC
ncbi:hypothetical protein COO60DRAFT_703581 [Scenedesmus sp. NREL 46B-D3]|nr:hypothetical protein COO60DRAFT_703581 [Scenedesmus sp. NREL 46B-D3]